MVNNYFDLLGEFVKGDFKNRYKNSILGFLWMLLKPLAEFFIMYFVWNALWRTENQTTLFLLSGVIFWNYFNDGIMLGFQSLLNKSGIILQINFPREVVIFSATTVALINFVVTLVIILVFAMYTHTTFTWAGIGLAAFSLITLNILIITASFFLSIWGVIVKDVRHLVELGLRIGFWATPVMYDASLLSPRVQKVIKLNPLSYLLEGFRTGLIRGHEVTGADYLEILKLLGIILIFTVIGFLYFKKSVKRVAEFF
ncbi:hypothetical protein GF357_00555 [Candidatus Dojkabacteria bacterium]|nr:hypothetical protein [Candidatus Dojkabacteria bacterium]